jgi:hypothetical protein
MLSSSYRALLMTLLMIRTTRTSSFSNKVRYSTDGKKTAGNKQYGSIASIHLIKYCIYDTRPSYKMNKTFMHSKLAVKLSAPTFDYLIYLADEDATSSLRTANTRTPHHNNLNCRVACTHLCTLIYKRMLLLVPKPIFLVIHAHSILIFCIKCR